MGTSHLGGQFMREESKKENGGERSAINRARLAAVWEVKNPKVIPLGLRFNV